MKKLVSADCAVGDYMVVYHHSPKVWTGVNRLFPDYATAEDEAKLFAKNAGGQVVYIVQIAGQLQSVTEVVEVHPNE